MYPILQTAIQMYFILINEFIIFYIPSLSLICPVTYRGSAECAPGIESVFRLTGEQNSIQAVYNGVLRYRVVYRGILGYRGLYSVIRGIVVLQEYIKRVQGVCI